MSEIFTRFPKLKIILYTAFARLLRLGIIIMAGISFVILCITFVDIKNEIMKATIFFIALILVPIILRKDYESIKKYIFIETVLVACNTKDINILLRMFRKYFIMSAIVCLGTVGLRASATFKTQFVNIK